MPAFVPLPPDSDIRIRWNGAELRGDWALLASGLIETGDDLVTAVLVSLFSDRLAEASDIMPAALGDDDRRGWHGDTWLDGKNAGDRLGSRLWLLPGSVMTEKTPIVADGSCREALKWLLDDRVVQRVDVDCFLIRGRRDRLGIQIDLWRRADPGEPVSMEFDWSWQQRAG